MEEALERVKKAAAGYRPGQEASSIKATRTLLAAVVACLKYIKDNAQEDRGCAERIVRDLNELLSSGGGYQKFAVDNKSVNRLHTRKLAEEHLEQLKERLEGIVKESEESKQEAMRGWVNQHPVFKHLKQSTGKACPKNAYILLFRQGDNEQPELVTQKSADGRVFTRLRAPDFANDIKVYKIYHNKPPIVGAAVIADKELLSAIGSLPQPPEGKNQLQTLLTVSGQAAGKPAKDFVEQNSILGQLNVLARQRKIPRDGYVLLFEASAESADESVDAAEESIPDATEESVPDAADESVPEAVDESVLDTIEEQVPDATDEPVPNAADESIDEAAGESIDEAAGESIDDAADESVDAATDGSVDATDESIDDAADEAIHEAAEEPGDQTADESVNDSIPYTGPPPKIVVKTGNEGKIISRFWPAEFLSSYKLFESFRGKPPIIGAAIIKQSELVQVLGHVPLPVGKQTQMDALLKVSRSAVEKPFMDFVADNDVLKGLHELANGSLRSSEAHVILFALGEAGRVEVISLKDRSGTRSRIPIYEFQIAKVVHERLAGKSIAGASVIGELQAPARHHAPPAGARGKSENSRRPPPGANRPKPVVLAAFGRTPLKVNLLATPETLRRLGIEL
jgi:hypothetical protein